MRVGFFYFDPSVNCTRSFSFRQLLIAMRKEGIHMKNIIRILLVLASIIGIASGVRW
jgi:hypothetical protein